MPLAFSNRDDIEIIELRQMRSKTEGFYIGGKICMMLDPSLHFRNANRVLKLPNYRF